MSPPGSGRTLRVEELWGTVIGVTTARPVDPDLIDPVFTWFHRVDDLFSTWRPDTEISRLARGELRLDDASTEVRAVLALCDEVRAVSEGAFDITVGADPRVAPRAGLGPIDPSGLVKGWALERAADSLAEGGVTDFTVNAGGDVLTRGRPAPGEEWRVGIQHPWERHKVAAVVAGIDIAIATSGRYEQGEHIIDPRTGTAPAGLMAVTVIGADLALADGYATAAIALGEDGMQWLAQLPGVEAMGITDTREVVLTDAFAHYRRC